MALYGDVNINSLVKRVGVGDGLYEFVAAFATAAGSAPTIDAIRTRGVLSIARTGTGVYEVALPFGLRHIDVQISMSAHPASAILNALKWSATEGARIITLTNTVISSGAAGDTTGVGWNVRISGRNG